MTTRSKETLKSYFQTGDRPTQQQYADLIDSLAHTSEIGGTDNTLKISGTNFNEYENIIDLSGDASVLYLNNSKVMISPQEELKNDQRENGLLTIISDKEGGTDVEIVAIADTSPRLHFARRKGDAMPNREWQIGIEPGSNRFIVYDNGEEVSADGKSIFGATTEGQFFIGNVPEPTSVLHIKGVQEYRDDAEAQANGLTTGAVYHDRDGLLKIVR